MLHNETANGNHWLTITLEGTRSNRDGIGAEIRLTSAHSRQNTTVNTAGSYLSSNDKRAHFGLGPDASAAAVEVRWPSGTVQTLTDVKADRELHIKEPPGPPAK